ALGLALPEVGDAVAAPGLDVSVDAVVGDVELPSEVPPRVRLLPLEQRRERLEPAHAFAALALPERFETLLVDPAPGGRLGRELGRGRVPALLEEQGVDRTLAHPVIFAHRTHSGEPIYASAVESPTAAEALAVAIGAGVPVLLWGSPGTGKTSAV